MQLLEDVPDVQVATQVRRYFLRRASRRAHQPSCNSSSIRLSRVRFIPSIVRPLWRFGNAIVASNDGSNNDGHLAPRFASGSRRQCMGWLTQRHQACRPLYARKQGFRSCKQILLLGLAILQSDTILVFRDHGRCAWLFGSQCPIQPFNELHHLSAVSLFCMSFAMN